jgi:hypothetical protein
MPPTIVLVTFYSRGGSTERLATAAAVGAVQARAAIRLRRVPDADPAGALERFPEHAETLRRMQKEYATPREADVIAADVLIFASTPEVSASAPVWSPFCDLLAHLQSQGKLAGKVGAAIDNGAASASFSSLIERLGLVAVPPVTTGSGSGDEMQRSVALGRQAVTVADALKAHT